jgi:hypothetical protein
MTLFDIHHRFKPAFFISSLILWAILAGLAAWLGDLSWGQAIVAGLLATCLHWDSEWLHQMGHAWVAKQVGYPMQRIVFSWFLAAGLYPKNERKLPPEIHIKRALGGAPVSFVLALLGWLILTLFQPTGIFGFLVKFYIWENFVVFGLGAYLPLGFTDGSTLLEWLPLYVKGRKG